MIEEGVITGSQLILNPKNAGFQTCAFVGIQVNLTKQTTHQEVFSRIKEIPEIVECHHITGKYSLLAKIYARDNEHLKKILVERFNLFLRLQVQRHLFRLKKDLHDSCRLKSNF